MHSFVDQMTDFEEALDAMDAFLCAHPYEFLIVSIKEDADPIHPAVTFADAVEQMLNEYADPVSTADTLPQTVGDARGKTHILARYADAGIGVPAYHGWQDNTSFVLDNLFVQDLYAIADTAEKLTEAENAFAAAAEGSYALVLNFTSCYLTHGFPPMYAASPAKPIHAWLGERLDDDSIPGGVIICDFMTSALAHAIWGCNFR